ncbi:hypothetical protein EXN66_Car018275 [Channa argus]|uniref:Uncharacterized protein n=1 Tax=Channa argus TaxID=215402 RepID=A0A6G1QJD9_CHAAH|nr:hypothetical protein EXN66_Car018275 [Channa argus]KAK2890429.1 hypothetical protein Q8A73_018729 [Channa argus]
MAEQPTQGQPEGSAASAQTPHSVHIELPSVNPDDVFFIISKCLLDILVEHWDLLKSNYVTSDILTALAASCMEIVQKLAEGILDIIIPQFYSYIRTHGSISPPNFRVTEDQIQAYMEDSLEQALTMGLKINVRYFSHTKMFSQLLQGHISRTVNSVLVVFTQSPTLVSRLPVILVSGCVTSITNLKHMVNEMATMLTYALNPEQRLQEFIDDKSSSAIKCDELDSPLFCFNSRDDFRDQMKAYLIYMLEVLRKNLEKPCQISSKNKRVICILVGTNTKILTVEDSESHGHKSPKDSCCDLNSIPGSVPETDKAESLTIARETEDRSRSVDSTRDFVFIRNIVDELMQAFMDDVHTEEETAGAQTAGLQLDAAKEDTIRKVTNRIFDLLMNGHIYQIPTLLPRRHVGDTITYARLMRGNIVDQGIIAHTVYMSTEEVVTRCVVQMLLWTELNIQKKGLPSPTLAAGELSPEPDFEEDKPSEEETQQCMFPFTHRTAFCIKKKCSTLQKIFSNFTRAMCRPFMTCCKPESHQTS